jgi:hypothetical protein
LFAKKNPVSPIQSALDWRIVARRVAPPMPLDYYRLYQGFSEGKPDIWAGRCRSMVQAEPVVWVQIDGEINEGFGGRTVSTAWDATDDTMTASPSTIRRELSLGPVGEEPSIQLNLISPAKGRHLGEGRVGEFDVRVENPQGRMSFLVNGSPLVQLYRCWSDVDARRHIHFRTPYSSDLPRPLAAAAGVVLLLLQETFGPVGDFP